MKKFLLLLAAGLFPLAASAQVNVIVNGSFEAGTIGDTDLTSTASINGWHYYDAGHTGSSTAYFDDTAYGFINFGLAADGHRFVFAGGAGNPGNGVYQDITVLPGAEYTASAYFRYLGVSEPSITARMLVLDQASNLIATYTTNVTGFTSTASPGADGWAQYSFTFTSPTESALRFVIYDAYNINSDLTPGGDLEFDNVAVVGPSPIPEPSTYAAFAGLAALGLVAWRRRQALRA